MTPSGIAVAGGRSAHTREEIAQALGRLDALVKSVADDEVRQQLEAEVTELAAHVVGLVSEHRLLEAQNEYLTRLSRRDEATGLFNQRHFVERLEDEFRRALRYATPLSLLIADLDDFKQVNDERGHLVGNEVLRRVARTVRQAVRETDTAARYGGDEFALLLPQTGPHQAMRLAERMRTAVVSLPDCPSLSIGVASLTPQTTGPVDLLTEADRAMYQAKALGKNRVVKGSPLAWTTGRSSAV